MESAAPWPLSNNISGHSPLRKLHSAIDPLLSRARVEVGLLSHRSAYKPGRQSRPEELRPSALAFRWEEGGGLQCGRSGAD